MTEYYPTDKINEVPEIVNDLSPDARDAFMDLAALFEEGYKQHLIRNNEQPRKFGPLQSAELILALVRLDGGKRLMTLDTESERE